jgi:hypothetical protein
MKHLIADKTDERTSRAPADSPLPFARFGPLTKKTFFKLDCLVFAQSMMEGKST